MYKFEDLIEEVKEFNTDLRYELDDIVGVTIEKGLIPTIANLTQTALDKFYIIKPETFVYNPRTHGVRLGMGYNDTCNTYITTWNNVAFRVKDTAKNIVIPQYLWLYFCRPVWDRLTNFLAWGSSTIVFAWKDFLTIEIDLPSITRQREIVAEYETLTRRIRINEQMIQNLESTAQTLYRKMFVDGIDKENLPDGWIMGTLREFGNIITGKTPSSDNPEDFGCKMPFVTPGDFTKYKKFAIGAERMLSDIGIKRLKNKVLPKSSVIVTCIGSDMGKVAIATENSITNQQMNSIIVNCEEYSDYLFYTLSSMAKELKAMALGSSTMPLLNKSDFEQITIIMPPFELLKEFYKLTYAGNNMVILKIKENKKLAELQSLLLAKMGQ